MSVVCDRPVLSPYNNGGTVRQAGKRKEFDRDIQDHHNRRFYISDHLVEEEGEEEDEGSGSRSDGRSSIGVESDSDFGASSSVSSLFCAEEEGEEVESEERNGGGGFGLGLMGTFDSLEESLPIKRGLSSFFSGKSKSFASLSSAAASCSTASDLSKPENPFNKRRRILMACNRRASYSSFISSLPPLLSPELKVEEETEQEDEDEEKCEENNCVNTSKVGGILKRSLASPRSFSFSDLQHV
ncbi:hypothetical protein LUZ60_001625 [Juncus effusus]|nr:hypothetical protein LUZ60_001625 [Juncus effusus]